MQLYDFLMQHYASKQNLISWVKDVTFSENLTAAKSNMSGSASNMYQLSSCTIATSGHQQDKTDPSHHGLNPTYVPYLWVYNPTLSNFGFRMIGRVNIERPKSHNAMNAWQPQASYPCGNLSDTFFFVIKRINRPTSPCHILKRKVKLALSPDTCAII